jgi:hypothetical protein
MRRCYLWQSQLSRRSFALFRPSKMVRTPSNKRRHSHVPFVHLITQILFCNKNFFGIVPFRRIESGRAIAAERVQERCSPCHSKFGRKAQCVCFLLNPSQFSRTRLFRPPASAASRPSQKILKWINFNFFSKLRYLL